MAKAAAGDAQHLVFRHAIQLFGGIGYTWENDVHLYLRRAKAGELLLGGAAQHRALVGRQVMDGRSEEHTSELQSLMRISYAVFCLKKKKKKQLNKKRN